MPTWLSTIISKLFPIESTFKNEIWKLHYYDWLYNLFPEILQRLKYKNYLVKEFEVIKLILDAGTYILKQLDAPFYTRYANNHVKICKEFYKLIYKLDKERIANREPKVSSEIRKQIRNAFVEMKLSKKHLNDIKDRIYWRKSNVAIYRYYKEEAKLFNSFDIKHEQIP